MCMYNIYVMHKYMYIYIHNTVPVSYIYIYIFYNYILCIYIYVIWYNVYIYIIIYYVYIFIHDTRFIFISRYIIEGSLEVKLPTIWTDEKQSREEAERRERLEERRSDSFKEDADARKGRKVAKHCVFPMICGSGESKSRLAKAAGAEPAGQMRDEKLHAVVARSTFPSQNVPKHTRSGPLWKLGCRKSARRCGAKHISKSKCTKHLSVGHFWKLRCQKSARRCGAKHISKSKCTKHQGFGPLLEVAMSKKCTPLWREAHFEVNM